MSARHCVLITAFLAVLTSAAPASAATVLTLTNVRYEDPAGPVAPCEAALPPLGGAGSAKYTDPGGGYVQSWEWAVPTTVTKGQTVTTKVTATSNNSSGISASIKFSAPAAVEPGKDAEIYAQQPPGAPGATTTTETYTFADVPEPTVGQKATLRIGTNCVSFLYEYTATAEEEPSGCGAGARAHAAQSCPAACSRPGARAAAVNEVRVVAITPGVEVHKAGTPEDRWCPVRKDTVLQQGDEISCDPDGSVTLQFADNSTVVVRNTTQLKIASFFTEGGVVKTEILLRMGEVAAQVHKSEATRSDFVIKTNPGHTGSVRGTRFSVFYDPGSKASSWSVTEGVVAVAARPGGTPVLVPAGREVEVTGRGVGKPAKLGKAGARGGVGRSAAVRRVLKLIARSNGPCGVRTPRSGAFAVTPAPRGWKVSVKVTGRRKGTSRWTVRGRTVRATNGLARRLRAGCG